MTYYRSTYRTKTYIAGDWTGDQDLINQLYKWNNSDYWGLHFIDAHDMTQSSDISLNCSIKASLAQRMDASKTFVLVVGDKTIKVRAGSCFYCNDYDYTYYKCKRGRSTSLKSFIEYECDKAVRDGLRIVVIYNSAYVYKDRCPAVLKNEGNHLAAYHWEGIYKIWNYQEIKKAIMGV